jgi:hypothetical protein
MSFNFTGFQLTPGMHDDRFTQEAQIYWGRWDQIEYLGGIIASTATDDGDAPGTQLRAGLAMGTVASTGKWLQWNPYATDGTQHLTGFLLGEMDVLLDSSTNKDRVFALMVKGNIKADQIVITDDLAGGTTAARGIVGTDYELLLRGQASPRFLFDDDMGSLMMPKTRTILTGDIAETLTKADNNTFLSLADDAAADCVVTLPIPLPGFRIKVCNNSPTAATTLDITTAAGSELWVDGATASTKQLAGAESVITHIEAIETDTNEYNYVFSTVGP